MLLKVLPISAIILAVGGVDFEIENRDGATVWIGIQGNPGYDHLNNGGFMLQQNEKKTIYAPDDWQGSFWSRTLCNASDKNCKTGDCGNRLECGGNGGSPPVTLIEISLKAHEGFDFYDVSLMDGFNTKASIEPIDGQGDGGQYSCSKANCIANINQECPEELQLKHKNQVIGCKSACGAFNTDEYCCRGGNDQPETCKSTEWPKNYPKFFKDRCPDAYSYIFDDRKTTFSCKADKYKITFGG